MREAAPPAVRPAVPGDAAAVAEVQTLGWQQAYVGLIPAEVLDGLSLPAARRGWQTRLRRPGRETVELVAEVDGRVCGMAVVGPSRDDDAPADGSCGELGAIYVLSASWGAGVGYALHERGMRLLVWRGCTRATVWVLSGNIRAMRFYARQGWRPDGRTKVDDRSGVTLLEERWAVELGGRWASDRSTRQTAITGDPESPSVPARDADPGGSPSSSSRG